jgi:hypothetical protein
VSIYTAGCSFRPDQDKEKKIKEKIKKRNHDVRGFWRSGKRGGETGSELAIMDYR